MCANRQKQTINFSPPDVEIETCQRFIVWDQLLSDWYFWTTMLADNTDLFSQVPDHTVGESGALNGRLMVHSPLLMLTCD